MQGTQGGGSLCGARFIEVIELLLRDTAGRKDVVWEASCRRTNARRAGGGTRHQQSIGDALEVQVLLIGIEKRRVEVLPIGVIAPRVREFTLGAEHGAIIGMVELCIPGAAVE